MSPAHVIRHHRTTLLLGAAFVGACAAIDTFLPRRELAWALRAAWVLTVLAGAALQRPERPRLATRAGQVTGFLSGAFVVAITWVTGGSDGLYAGVLLATPLTLLAAFPDLPSVAVLGGSACLGGGVAMKVAEGRPAHDIAAFALVCTFMVVLAAWGTVMSRRLLRGELEAERARARALQDLAESERRRVDAERLAEVGRLAARVAHEINNPLAVVKTTVAWLEEETLPRDVPEGERREVRKGLIYRFSVTFVVKICI